MNGPASIQKTLVVGCPFGVRALVRVRVRVCERVCVCASKCPLQIFKAAGTPDSLTRTTLTLFCKHTLLSLSLSLSLTHTLTVNLLSSFFSVTALSQSDSIERTSTSDFTSKQCFVVLLKQCSLMLRLMRVIYNQIVH